MDVTTDEQIPGKRVARWRRCAGAGLLAAALAACTLGPDYKRPALDLPPTWRAEPSDAADVANTEWWKAFGDAKLDALIEAALTANKDLRVATYRVAEFDARLQVSRSAAFPEVGYVGSAQRQRYSEEVPTGGGGLQSGVGPIVNNFAIGAVFDWEIDLWGKVRRANEAALAELLASEAARRGVMLTVVADAATAYVQLLELDRQLALLRQSVKNRQEALEVTALKQLGGSATLIAVEQARASLEAEQAEIPPLERDIAVLEAALSTLVGRNPGAIERRRLDDLLLPQIPVGVPADVLARRPDVMTAEQNLIAANARIGVAKTGYFPTLSLAAAIGLATDNLRWLFAETARTGLIGAGLGGPIYNAGRTEGEVRQAEAFQQQMQTRFEQSVQTALREVESALVARQKSGQREQTLGRQAASQREVSKLTRMRYEGGQSTLLDVLDAELKLQAVERSQIQSRRDTFLALVSVYRAMGGGWMVEYDKNHAPADQALASGTAAQAGVASQQEAMK